MLNVFSFSEYKVFLQELIHSKQSRRGIQSQLARHLKCQPSYLYRVLQGEAHLTDDQAFKVTTFLELSANQRDYFLLLHRLGRASTPELVDFLKKETVRLKKNESDLRNKADAESPADHEEMWIYYFSSALPSAIHMLTSSKLYQTSRGISARLRISETLAKKHLEKLQRYGLVSTEKDKWVFSGNGVHFPKDSNFNLALQLIRRSQVQNSILASSPDNTHFSTLFTLDKSAYETLRVLVANFIEKTQKFIHSEGAEEMYVLCVDMFKP